MEEANAHLLLDVRPFEDLAELLERNGLVAVAVCFQNSPVSDGRQLIGRDVGADHHVQDGEQFFARDLGVVVQVVPAPGSVRHAPSLTLTVFPGLHFEGEAQLLLAVVELVVAALLDGTEARQDTHELTEVDALLAARLAEEGLHDAVAERVDGQLWDAQEVLAGQGAVVALVQTREATVQPLDLTWRDWPACKWPASAVVVSRQRPSPATYSPSPPGSPGSPRPAA